MKRREFWEIAEQVASGQKMIVFTADSRTWSGTSNFGINERPAHVQLDKAAMYDSNGMARGEAPAVFIAIEHIVAFYYGD
jgi:hypothetical protein